MTENDELRQELDRLRARFDEELEQQKLDALAEFAAGAGHEINNPLAIIGGHARMLLREIEHPEHRRQLAVIAAQVQRAYEMIADIRFFARPPAPEPETFDLLELLHRLVEEQTEKNKNPAITLRFDDEWENPVEITTDPVLFHVVLSALCNNAREILEPDGGEVRIQLRQHESFVQISVEDDGPGVSEETRPLIFCPYYSGREAGRGLGFGLPKAWRIMQLLGGSIRYETPESPGARFVVEVPFS